MEILLDAAHALAQQSDPPRPDFPLPDEYAHLRTDQYLTLQPSPKGGQGWYAVQDLPAGTLLMVSKPIAMVMDWQDDSQGDGDNPQQQEDVILEDDDDDEDNGGGGRGNMRGGDNNNNDDDDDDKEPRLNEILLLMLLELLAQQPYIWQSSLSTLFPRDATDLSRLPAWVCEDDAVFCQVEALVQKLSERPELQSVSKDIAKRLPLIIRYNILSIETCPELLSYPSAEGHASLSGVGLYHWPSFFNHSSQPNCSRYNIGDVLFIVTNQDIAAGNECCISYLEHDILCESPYRRHLMLRMDFIDGSIQPTPEEEEGPELPVVDTHVQNELMELDPFRRLSALEDLMEQAVGNRVPSDNTNGGTASDIVMGSTESAWFQCDLQNLRILKAITLDGMGQTREALELWEEAVQFCETTLPPNDESTIVMRVQAALCAYHAGLFPQAHAEAALRIHQILFGGGVERFRRRLGPDLRLKLRPERSAEAAGLCPVDALWPLR
jgi:hypothetical protein